MYLNIILTIFTVIQLVVIIMIYKWWNKYGRNIYKTFANINKNTPKIDNPFKQIPDLGEMMKELNQLTKNMKK